MIDQQCPKADDSLEAQLRHVIVSNTIQSSSLFFLNGLQRCGIELVGFITPGCAYQIGTIDSHANP